MASVSKKISSDEYELIADTQGLLIPAPPAVTRYSIGTLNITGGSEGMSIPLTYVDGTVLPLNGSGKIIVRKGDVYSVKIPCFRNDTSADFPDCFTRCAVYSTDGTSSITAYIEKLIKGNSQGSNAVLLNTSTHTVYCPHDGYLDFFILSSNSVVLRADSWGYYYEITKLVQQVPYLVANKGALVSGGAFEFDLDGNCFPEIYSTDEVLCGRWIDGKPIYKKTIDCGYLPDTAKKTINVNIPVLQVIIKMEGFYYGNGLWGPLPYTYLSSLNDGVIVWLNAGKYLNIQTMSNRSDQYAYVTLYYLKTAD